MRTTIAQKVLDFYGWKVEGEAPRARKYVLIAAPHTTNWDFVFTMCVARVLGVKMRFLAKKSLFRWPFNHFFEAFGGIAVDRSGGKNTVDAMIDLFSQYDDLALMIAVEGTRRRGERWKSGFYHVARGANVPVAMGWLDYERKRGGIGNLIHLTGDVKADMDEIRAFYAGVKGKFPEQFTPPRLAEEEDVKLTG